VKIIVVVDTAIFQWVLYTSIDGNTQYVWVCILKRKSQVFQKFVEWKNLQENLYETKIKTLRIRGGAYTSTDFRAYLRKEGVHHELTVPNTPQQNGIRMNRTLVETVHSMLSGAKLPKKFWAETLNTAVYLQNHSPTRAVQRLRVPPFEALIKQKSDVICI